MLSACSSDPSPTPMEDDKKPSGDEDSGGGAAAMDGSVPSMDGGIPSDVDANTPEPDSGLPANVDAGPDGGTDPQPSFEDFYDDFNACELDETNWEFRLPPPAADAGAPPSLDFTGAGTSNAVAELVLPAGVVRDANKDGLGVPRLMHPFGAGTDEPFQVVVKFDSALTELIQIQGILFEDGTGQWLRADLSYFTEGDTLLFWGSFDGKGKGVSDFGHILGLDAPHYLRVARLSGTWDISTSEDGVSWVEQASFPNAAFNVQSVGVFGGSAVNSGVPSAPAHTVKIDAFSLRADVDATGTGFNREDRDDVSCP